MPESIWRHGDASSHNFHTDPQAKRLQDFRHMPEFLDLYDRNGSLRITEIPGTDRAVAEEILERIGDLNDNTQTARQKLLTDIAIAEAYVDSLAIEVAHAEEIGRLQREYTELRVKITGPPADPDKGLS